MERSRGLDDHNLISSFMRENGSKDLKEALNTLDAFNRQTVSRFLSTANLLPSWGDEIDTELKSYIDGIGSCIRGADCWSFECERYFQNGSGAEVKKTRMVTLAPASRGYVNRPRARSEL